MSSADDVLRTMRRHVVIEGFPPNITPALREKFGKLLRLKIAQKLQIDDQVFQLTFISDPAGLTVGAFAEFARESDAARATEICHMLNLTKTDAIRVYSWETFATSEKVAETYEPPEVDMARDAVDVSNSMMMDKEARPVFLVKAGDDFDVVLYRIEWQRNDVSVLAKPNPTKDNAVGRWTMVDRRRKHCVSMGTTPMPCWSPLGTHLLSLSLDGLTFWAGDPMQVTCLIPHDNVQAVHITPSERFAVVRLPQTVEIWDLKHSVRRHTLFGLDFDLDVWPPLKFSAGDVTCCVVTQKVVGQRPTQKIVERKGDDGKVERVTVDSTEDVYCQRITFFETETMKVMQGPERVGSYSMKVPGLRVCEWSPTDPNILVFLIEDVRGTMGWRLEIQHVTVSHVDSLAGRQPLVSLSPRFSRVFVKAQKLDVLWHPHGTHVAAKVVIPSSAATAATEYCLFEVGQLASTAQQLRVEGSPLRFVWQPHGTYFAVSVLRRTGNAGAERCTVIVYGFGGPKGSIAKIGAVPTTATNLYWSPYTGRLLAVNYEAQTIELVKVTPTSAAVSARVEYKGLTNVEWDSSGRFFAAWARTDKNRPGQRARWTVYDFNAKVLHDGGDSVSTLSHVSFRPASRSVLSAEDVAKAKASLPELIQRWDANEAQAAQEEATRAAEGRRRREEAYLRHMNDIAAFIGAQGLDDTRAALEASAPSVRAARRSNP